MTSRPRRAGDSGVSLIEVLVSLSIFAIIGVAGLAVLNTVSRTGERTDARLERLSDIDRSFLILRRDLMQMDGLTATLDAGIMSFRRPFEEVFVAVDYLAEEGALLRRVQLPSIDPADQHLLEDIRSADWQLMDGRGRWHTSWPPGVEAQRPHAAELRLALPTDNGESAEIIRIFPLAAGQGQ